MSAGYLVNPGVLKFPTCLTFDWLFRKDLLPKYGVTSTDQYQMTCATAFTYIDVTTLDVNLSCVHSMNSRLI